MKKYKYTIAKSQVLNIINAIINSSSKLFLDKEAMSIIKELYNNGNCSNKYKKFKYIIDREDKYFFKYNNINNIIDEFDQCVANFHRMYSCISVSFEDFHKENIYCIEPDELRIDTNTSEWFQDKLVKTNFI